MCTKIHNTVLVQPTFMHIKQELKRDSIIHLAFKLKAGFNLKPFLKTLEKYDKLKQFMATIMAVDHTSVVRLANCIIATDQSSRC